MITSIENPPFGAAALSFLRRITPHLQRAMRLIEERGRWQTQWALIKATLDGIDYGILACDEIGQVLVGNDARSRCLPRETV